MTELIFWGNRDGSGYFITQVEFQPSGREKGLFLNVGISFLWEYSETLITRLASNYGHRMDVDNKEFVCYHDYYIEWRGKLFERCVQYIQLRLDSRQNAQKMILEMIERRRKYFETEIIRPH